VYKTTNQLSIEDFVFPYGSLRPDNRWVLMAALIPWDAVERGYAAGFANNGAPAHPARMALGSLVAKQVLGCSDEELVNQIAENPYLQFFCGMREFSEECPFGASTLVAFRKRFSDEDIRAVNEAMLAAAGARDGDGGDDEGGDGGGERTMSLDATVAPSDIAYPQDVLLLNSAREHLEGIIACICAQTGSRMPRMYRNVARRDFLAWSKSKKRTSRKTRKAVRRQLGYVARDLRYATGLIEELDPDLSERQLGLLRTIEALYAQQKHMYDSRTHTVKGRIVSISQPWVRPIVRGKANANTEFGAKVHVSCDDGGCARIEDACFDAYNESEGLIGAAEAYCEREGRYPDRILADQIYRTRKNLSWCKERGIRLSGPRLGRPPKGAGPSAGQKATERKDAADRNVVEGVFGTAKTAYGLSRVKARLEGTTLTVISLAILVFNLRKLANASLARLLDWLLRALGGSLQACARCWFELAHDRQLVTE